MAETDYNEILLEAIDAIVVSRISEVNFDRTIVATIVDASKAKDGEYVLSDGSVQFTVRNGSDKYKENDRVNVLIPSNDFSSTEKTILGKTSANTNDIPITYVSPLEKIVPMETNYAAGLKGGITANSETERFQLTNVEWITVNESTLGYDTLCVSARFKTLLNDYDIRQGHYGLLVQLQTTNGYIHALTLDSAKDMFGNPYGYSMYLTQEQTYHLNLQDNIIGIKIDLYQMKDFKYNDGVNSELQVLPVMPYSNILVDNINVSFGYNAEQVEDNTVKISTADSLTYDNIKDASVTKKLTLTWYNKDENNKYLGFTDGAFANLSAAQTTGSQKYYIKWEHSLNNGQWEEIQETGREQELTVNLNMAWGLNEYRAIVVFDGVSYISNIIQFKNATGIDNPQERLQMLLTLHNVVDSSYDSYPLYGSDGLVINPLDATQNRKVYFSYSSEIGGSLEPDVLKGATAYFYIPQNSTMLEVPGGDTNWDDDQDGDHSKVGYVAYVKRFSKEQTELTVEEKTFLYRIKANYNPLFTNNNVILRIVDKNGFIYETSKTFSFSSYGTSGTDYSIVISGANGENGWVGSNGFTPKAQLYDANYKEIADINWTWSKYPTGTAINANQPLSSETTFYQAIKAQTAVSWVGKNVQISGIYPISYSSNEDYMYQGPTTIIYNNNGVKPSYYNGDLGIFKKSDNSKVTCTWSIEYFTKSNDDVSGDKKPWLSWGELTVTTDGHTRFKPSSMYLGDTYYLVLVAKSGSKILWRQPLIILQNQYASGLLNNWDGNLIVDNENNYILSSMMGAGSKDSQNRFSGVLMGEVGKVADNAAETGLFGYYKGAQSFGFRTDGTAFIGKSGAGRIEFDGSKGVIQSAKYGELNASGSKWDLANGSIILNGSGGEYFKFNEKNDGKLEMKLSGADIILSNQGDENLTSYIVATANSITQKVESMAAMDYVGTAPNELRQQSSQDGYYLNIDIPEITNASDTERFSKAIPIFRHGTLLEVTFTKASVNAANTKVKAKIWLNILKVGEGASSDNNGYPIWVNGAVTSTDNPLEWNAGDKLWFKFILTEVKDPTQDYNKGYWIVYDPYGVAQLEVKADNINASVLHKNGTNTGTGFGWNLTDSEWKVGAIKNNVLTPTLTVNKDGLTVNGHIVATSIDLSQSLNKIKAEYTEGFSNVAISGSYNDLSDQPSVPKYVADLKDGGAVITTSKVTVETSTDNKGVTKTVSKIGDVTYTTYTADADDYVLTDVGIGTSSGDHSGKFVKLSKEGLLTADNAIIYGELHATSGAIGGWGLTNGTLISAYKNGNAYYGIGLDANKTAFDNNYRVFAIGQLSPANSNDYTTSWGTAAFSVKADGSLYASNADITGNITAKNLTIQENAIIKGTLSANNIKGGSFNSGSKISLGGWNIGDHSLYSSDTGYGVLSLYNQFTDGTITANENLSSENWRILVKYQNKYTFGVTREGFMSCGQGSWLGNWMVDSVGNLVGKASGGEDIIKLHSPPVSYNSKYFFITLWKYNGSYPKAGFTVDGQWKDIT